MGWMKNEEPDYNMYYIQVISYSTNKTLIAVVGRTEGNILTYQHYSKAVKATNNQSFLHLNGSYKLLRPCNKYANVSALI